MAILSGFFPSVKGDRKYTNDFLAQWVHSFIGNGVYDGDFAVTAGENMNVVLPNGQAWINGYYCRNDGNFILPIANADGVLKRKDTIVLRWDINTRDISVKILTGKFASKPVAPPIVRSVEQFDLKLAEIDIPAGTTQITQADITDTRLDTDVCGIVHGTVEQVDTTTLYNQIQSDLLQFKSGSEADFSSWSEEQKEILKQFISQSELNYDNWSDEQKASFDSWFNGIKDILGEDEAANLLNLIEEHKADTIAHITAAEREKWNASGVSAYIHTKNGTVHNLKGAGNNIEFLATADIADGDTWTVNGAAVTATLQNGEALPADLFKSGSWVTGVRLDGAKLNFPSGGSSVIPNYSGKLIIHVATSDGGSVGNTRVRIRNEQLGANYVQSLDALGNTTFSLLDNHTYYVVLLDYPSIYYGAAATITITGGETQELTLTLDTTPHIVGWRMNIDTGVIEYTDGAATFEPMTVTDGTFHAGSWENQWAADVKPCLLKNLVVQYYLKKTGIYLYDYEHQANGTSSDIRTGADGDVMNELPLAYYKTGIETTGEGTFAYFKLAKEPQDDTWCANAYLSNSDVIQDTIYLPAYDGYVLNGKLRSLCGVAPTVNHTIGEFRTYANANGTGYEQANLTQVQYLNNLMILFFKSTNSQLAIGKGVTSGRAAINTGAMNDKPLFWGDQTGTNGMKFMGVENYYGNVRKWLDGVGYLATNHFGYKIVPPFNDDRTGYADSGVAIPTDGWINRMSRTNGYGMLPSATVSAEADSRYKDRFYGLDSNKSIVSWGGSWGDGSFAGAFGWYDNTVSYTYTYLGASLFATPQG